MLGEILSEPKEQRAQNDCSHSLCRVAIEEDILSQIHMPSDIKAVTDGIALPTMTDLSPNVIVFDDFVTTGSKLLAMKNLLQEHGKNPVFFAGINNKL